MKMRATRMMRVIGVVLALAVAIAVSGCGGRSFKLEEQLVAMSKAYQEDFAAKRFSKVMPVLTGDALDAMQAAAPLLEVADVQTKVLSYEGRVDFVNRDKTRASVEATYTQEQTIEGYGTSSTEITVVLDWKKMGDNWRIYSIKTVDKREEGSR